MGAVCNVFWGSHACDLPSDHDEEKHLCGANFEEDDKDALPGDWTGPCSRLRIDADGIGWIEHWSYLANDPEKHMSWSEPSEFPWAHLTPLEPEASR
jgi:hypothetical protein